MGLQEKGRYRRGQSPECTAGQRLPEAPGRPLDPQSVKARGCWSAFFRRPSQKDVPEGTGSDSLFIIPTLNGC